MQMIRHLWIRLRREPAFAAIFIITLALGVGANAALLSALRGYYLAPLPYPDAGRLVNIQQDFISLTGISMSSYRDLLAHEKDLSNGGLVGTANATIDTNGKPRIVDTAQVTPSLLQTLGVAPALGKSFSNAAGQPDGPREALLSYRFWKAAYGGSSDVVGKTIKINDETYNIVGVMPSGFEFPNHRSRIYLPLQAAPTDTHDYLNVSSWFFVARLAPGVSLSRFNASLKARTQDEIGRLKADERSMAEKKGGGYTLHAVPIRTALVGNTGPRLALIECGAALLFVLAVAILANLVTTRALGRRHEQALKLALGANRNTLWREALRDTLPLALIGAAAAFALAWVGIGLLVRYGFGGAGSAFTVTLDGWTLLATLLLSLLAGLMAALPAALGSSSRLLSRLVEGDHATPTRQSRLLQRGLSILQIALGVTLLTNAALIGIAYYKLSTRTLGFDTSNLVVASLGLHNQYYSNRENNIAFARQFARSAGRLPGFHSVGITNALPFGNTLMTNNVHRSGAATNKQIYPKVSYVTESTLHALGTHMIAGRSFDSADLTDKAGVAVLDADLARALFGSTRAALGQTLVIHKHTIRVVGVTRNVRWFPHSFGSLTGSLWLPYSILPESADSDGVYITVRTALPVGLAGRQLKELLSRTAPTLAFNWIRSMKTMTADAYRKDQAPAVLVGLFSLIALSLAAVGVYGTVAYLIRQRLGEFAVRQAVGATPARIGTLALAQGLVLAALGIALGIGGGFLLARALPGLGTAGPAGTALAYVGAALVMALAALLATTVPAQRARRADLLSLLRPQ